MEDKIVNNQLIDSLLEIITEDETKYVLFPTAFRYQMARTSFLTLKNINALTASYRMNYNQNNNKDKLALLLFGLLQGLFVAIDCLYTIAHTTMLSKIIINLNENDVLRNIKHIRNDVVGHPSYRQFTNDSVGFCALDLDHIDEAKINYQIFTFKNHQVQTEYKQIDLISVLDNYYIESNATLEHTLQILSMKQKHDTVDVASKVSILGFRFQKGIEDLSLLNEIKKTYQQTFHIKHKSSNRVLWRLRLIEKLFLITDKNPYINYLLILEIYKLYGLLYGLEKQFTPDLKYRFVRFSENSDFKLLKQKIKTIKKEHFDVTILHDSKHPLYHEHMEEVFTVCDDNTTKPLITWIKQQIRNNDHDMLYLIGSVLKK